MSDRIPDRVSDEVAVFPTPAATAVERAAVQLDPVDLTLLRLLAADARMSQRRLGREIGMSAPAVADRVARLERLGVIRGYRVDIDVAAIGFAMIVYVGLVTVQGSDQGLVLEALRRLTEVEDVQVVTGPKDMLVRLRVRDHAHLRDVLFERIWNIKGIDRSECYISLGAMPRKDFDVEVLDSLLTGAEAPAPRPVKET
jgi:DNA-binding Lrp family transcriptional regulator